jgi:non-ribosomal peptide synthetase component F
VKDASLNAFENQDVQFEALVEKLDLRRDPSRNPLFDVCFVVQNFEPSKVDIERVDELHFSPYEFENKISQFDLSINAVETGDDISFYLEYCTSLFKSDTIQRIARHFVTIIKGIAAEPNIRLWEIDMKTGEEKQQILFEFNDTDALYPLDKTIHQLFVEQVERIPDNIALVAQSAGRKAQSENEKRSALCAMRCAISYKELNQKANQLAYYLEGEKHIRSQDRVGLMMDRSLEGIVAIIGILKAGGAYVPLDPSLPEERIKNMIDDAGIRMVISLERNIVKLNCLQWECPTFDTFLCLDSRDIYCEEGVDTGVLESQAKLWEYVGKTAADDITCGGWISSYTGAPLSRQEMDEYSDNVLKKLTPLLHKQTRVLEIGCASGLTMYRIAPNVGFYYGTDLSRTMISIL